MKNWISFHALFSLAGWKNLFFVFLFFPLFPLHLLPIPFLLSFWVCEGTASFDMLWAQVSFYIRPNQEALKENQTPMG